MDNKEFKDLVVGTLKELIGRQDRLDNSIQQLLQETRADIQVLRTDLNSGLPQLKSDIKRIDRKTDDILKIC